LLSFYKTKTMAEDRINSSKAPEPVGAYPHARRVGNLLFLSGVGPRERGTKKIPGVELDEKGNIVSYDIEVQCKNVFQNIKYILEEAGSSWDNIVDVQVFLTNINLVALLLKSTVCQHLLQSS
jgi:2-aminomuconate deaminase